MLFVATGSFVSRENIAQFVEGERQKLKDLREQGAISNVYRNSDKTGVTAIVTAGSLAEAKEKMNELPLVANGLMQFQFIEVESI